MPAAALVSRARGLELALAAQLTETAGATYYELAEALEYAADYATAADAYESAFELCREHGISELARVCYACLSPVVRLMGEWDRSLAICTDVLGDDSTPQLLRMVAEEESGLITVLRADRARARGPLRRAAAFGRDNEIFGIEVGATWGLAMLADLDGNDAAAHRAVAASVGFRRAAELGVTAPYERALSELRWGAALAGPGDRSAAVDVVTRAYRTARNLGAKPLARSCAAQLAGMGEQVDRRLGRLAARSLEPAGPTRREREVLRLLAGGRTNRRIADELFLSTRTVDMHVRNLLGKLGCSSRLAGVQRAAELGLIDTSGARSPEVRQ